jgi:hypothetical protein
LAESREPAAQLAVDKKDLEQRRCDEMAKGQAARDDLEKQLTESRLSVTQLTARFLLSVFL